MSMGQKLQFFIPPKKIIRQMLIFCPTQKGGTQMGKKFQFLSRPKNVIVLFPLKKVKWDNYLCQWDKKIQLVVHPKVLDKNKAEFLVPCKRLNNESLSISHLCKRLKCPYNPHKKITHPLPHVTNTTQPLIHTISYA